MSTPHGCVRGVARLAILLVWLQVQSETSNTRGATPAQAIHVMTGFQVELLHTADSSEGSWISMTIDPKGRLIVSPQSQGNLLRLAVANGAVTNVERINQPLTSAMGLLYAQNSLYIDGSGPKGYGIYRLHDEGATFGSPVLLCSMEFSVYEHGSQGHFAGERPGLGCAA